MRLRLAILAALLAVSSASFARDPEPIRYYRATVVDQTAAERNSRVDASDLPALPCAGMTWTDKRGRVYEVVSANINPSDASRQGVAVKATIYVRPVATGATKGD